MDRQGSASARLYFRRRHWAASGSDHRRSAKRRSLKDDWIFRSCSLAVPGVSAVGPAGRACRSAYVHGKGRLNEKPNIPRTGDRDDLCPLEPITQRFIDDLMAAGGPPVYTLSPADARALLARQQSVPTAKPDAHIEDATFPVGPKGAVRVRIVRPKDSERLVPVIMHFHGGGWVLGDVNTHDRLIREIAVGAHAAVVFVDYDRAPEAQFPIRSKRPMR